MMMVGEIRDESIDIAKGILIVMLVFHHIVDVGICKIHINNGVLEAMRCWQRPIALCYFMPAFFLITGMCSTFNGSFRTFLRKQIRTLLIPGAAFALAYYLYELRGHGLLQFVFSYLKTGGCYWFLTALFGGKMLYYWLKRLVPNGMTIVVSLLALSFLGALLHAKNIFPNYFGIGRRLT